MLTKIITCIKNDSKILLDKPFVISGASLETVREELATQAMQYPGLSIEEVFLAIYLSKEKKTLLNNATIDSGIIHWIDKSCAELKQELLNLHQRYMHDSLQNGLVILLEETLRNAFDASLSEFLFVPQQQSISPAFQLKCTSQNRHILSLEVTNPLSDWQPSSFKNQVRAQVGLFYLGGNNAAISFLKYIWNESLSQPNNTMRWHFDYNSKATWRADFDLKVYYQRFGIDI